MDRVSYTQLLLLIAHSIYVCLPAPFLFSFPPPLSFALFSLSLTPPDDGFFEMQSGFMEKYYHEFEDSEENKFIYTDIFKQYVSKLPHRVTV